MWSLGGLPEAFRRPLRGFLGASWGSLGASGGRFDVEHHFGALEFFGRAVLEPSWGRFFSFLNPFWSYLIAPRIPPTLLGAKFFVS